MIWACWWQYFQKKYKKNQAADCFSIYFLSIYKDKGQGWDWGSNHWIELNLRSFHEAESQSSSWLAEYGTMFDASTKPKTKQWA